MNSIKPPLRTSMKGDCHGTKAENRLSKRLGGQTTRASGATANDKGDIKLGLFLVESKSTIHDSLTIQRSWLDKIETEAKHKQKHPALAIQYVDKQGIPVSNGSWVAMPESLFQELIEYANRKDKEG